MSAEAAPRRELGPPVTLLITITSVAATAMLMLTGPAAAQAVRAHGLEAAEFLGLSLVLQLFAVPVYRGGRVGVAAIGMLATGIVLGAPLAMAVAVVVALAHFVRARGALHRTVFDAGMMTLDAGAGAAIYHLLVRAGGGSSEYAVAAARSSAPASLPASGRVVAARTHFTWSGVQAGCSCRRTAAAPATWGAAKDVPLIVA